MADRPDHLFLCSGDLYDLRVADWSKLPPLRRRFEGHWREINTVADLKACLRAGSHGDGGYPLYFVCADGEALSFKAARQEFKLLVQALTDQQRNDGWRVVALDVNYENGCLYCAHTNEHIPAAYVEEGETV